MVKHPLFGEVSGDFNESAAMEWYELQRQDPNLAYAIMHMYAHQEVSKVALESPEVIEDLVFSKYAARKELVKDAILSGVVNKSMSNETVDAVVAAMDTISKAIGNEYTSWERAENVKQQRRDVKGRFTPMGRTKIDTPQGVRESLKSSNDMQHRGYWNAQTAAYDKVAQQRGWGTPPRVTQSAAANTAHSAAYLQVAEALKNLDPTDMVMADITYKKYDPDGKYTGPAKRTKIGMDVNDFISPDEFGAGEFPDSITWYMDEDSAGAGRFNVLTGAGMETQTALDVQNMASQSGPALKTFNERQYSGEYGGKKYGNLSALANMVDSVAGTKLSPEGKAALGAAKAVGEYGAEAEKVLGPTTRRAAYRYRGTEQKPDAKMDRAIAMSVAGSKSINDAHENLIHPKEITEQVGLDFETKDEHSPFIRYWQNKLPKREYVQLHLDSGTTPPSQGVVFDAKGQVISQSVGYGDDHYLPFNLQKLTKANRGEWVRTRSMGGPTTEDIYAALITGTRSITVVSHSGVYNVEFDESFRGGRRFNDKSKRMVRRYAQLLDTLDAESTTLQKIPQDRMEELKGLVAREVPGEGRAANQIRDQRMKELIEVERANPTPSRAQRSLWTAEFGQRYAEKLGSQDESDINWEGVKASLAIRNDTGPLTDDDAITLLGATESHAKFMKQKEAEYRTTQSPLKLNGQGYYFALQALQEQFPYAIKRVEWYPTDDQYMKDKGYVQHNFNRPKAVKEGFWSPEIEGRKSTEIKTLEGKESGKVPAHHTDYQNWANRQAVRGAPVKTTSITEDSAPKSTSATKTSAPTGPSGFVANQSYSGGGHKEPTYDTADAILPLGDAVAGVAVRFDNNSPETGVPLGKSRHQMIPYLGNWDETKNRLDDPEVLQGVVNDLETVFEQTNPVSTAVARSSPGLADQYRKDVASTLVAPVPKYAREAFASTTYFAFPNGNGQPDTRYLPGQNRDVYTVELPHTDPDLISWANRSKKFGDFEREFTAMESRLRQIKREEDSRQSVVYGDRTWTKGDVDELERVARQDLMGYLKSKQLARLGGGTSDVEIPDDLSGMPKETPKPPSKPSSGSSTLDFGRANDPFRRASGTVYGIGG